MLRVAALAVGVAVILFAIANRGPVAVDLAPLPVRLDVPLYLVALCALALGALVGGLGAWFSAAGIRRLARHRRRRIEALQDELADRRARRRPEPDERPVAQRRLRA